MGVETTRQGRPRLPGAVAALGALLLGGTLTACSVTDRACEERMAEIALSIDGVVSAEFDCEDNPSGGWERSEVVLDAATEDEAALIVDEVLRAYAEAPDLDPEWSTPQEYQLEGSSEKVSANDVGFDGSPTVEEAREFYGVEP